MSTVIRMARGGTKKRPYYRIVVADKRRARDGRYIERVGNYDPLLTDEKSKVDVERVKYWLGTGALPSERVAKLLKLHGVEVKVPKRMTGPGKPPARVNKAKRSAKKGGEAPAAEAPKA